MRRLLRCHAIITVQHEHSCGANTWPEIRIRCTRRLHFGRHSVHAGRA